MSKTLYYPIKPFEAYPKPKVNLHLITESDYALELWNWVWLNAPWLDRPGELWTPEREKEIEKGRGLLTFDLVPRVFYLGLLDSMSDGMNAVKLVEYLSTHPNVQHLQPYVEGGDYWLTELSRRAAISVKGSLYSENVVGVDFKAKRRVA